MDTSALNDVADRLFGAFVAHDLDAVAEMMAPDALVIQNGRSMNVPQAMAMIKSLEGVLGDHRYEDVRRIVGDHAIVEEHRVRSPHPADMKLICPLASWCVSTRTARSRRSTSTSTPPRWQQS